MKACRPTQALERTATHTLEHINFAMNFAPKLSVFLNCSSSSGDDEAERHEQCFFFALTMKEAKLLGRRDWSHVLPFAPTEAKGKA